MLDRSDIAPICIVIAELYDPEAQPLSAETLPPDYDMDANRRDAARALIRRAATAHLLSRHHSRILRAVVRRWDRQPAAVRSMTFGLLDLLRMVEDAGGQTEPP